jgi:hypothetical protein
LVPIINKLFFVQLSIAGVLGLTAEQLEQLAGIVLTNCVAVGEGDNGFGLFPIFSILSHSCLANTCRIIEDNVLTLRLVVFIVLKIFLPFTQFRSRSFFSIIL